MKINLTQLAVQDSGGRSFKNWQYGFLVITMTEHTENAQDWGKVFNIDDTKECIVDVVVTVNGVEIPFDKWMEHLRKSYTDRITECAQELLAEKFNNLQTVLYRAEEDVIAVLEEYVSNDNEDS